MQYTTNRWIVRIALALSIGLGAVNALNAQSLIWLGPGLAWDVSDDGRTVVGESEGKPAVWDISANGQVSRSLLFQESGVVRAVSSNGNRAAGLLWRSSTGAPPFVWNRGTGVSLLPPGCSWYCWTWDITADGALITGKTEISAQLPTVWDLRRNPPTYLQFAPLNMWGGEAYGIADNGWTVVAFGHGIAGRSYCGVVFSTVDNWAVRLDPVSGHFGCVPWEISSDGSVAVGNTGNFWGGAYYPAMWRAANNWRPEMLAHLGGSAGEAFDIKDTVIVGFSGSRAVRWNLATATTQVENLNQTYAALLTNGSELGVAYAISRGNRYIVGYGYNAATRRTEAYLLDTWRTGDTNGDGCVDDSDLLAVLFAFGTPGTGYTRHEDINKDGIVDDADLLIVLFNFGSGC